MRVYHRSHSPGHGEDNFALHDDIRQRIRDQEMAGTSTEPLFLHVSTNSSFTRIVLEGLHFFFSWRYACVFPECFIRLNDDPESGMSFIFDLAMQ